MEEGSGAAQRLQSKRNSRRKENSTRKERRILAKAASSIFDELSFTNNTAIINRTDGQNFSNSLIVSNSCNNSHVFLSSSSSSSISGSCSDSSICMQNLSNSETQKKPPLQDQLASWAKKHNIPNTATTDLLKILNPYFPKLPLDSRTILKTPRSVDVKKCCGGSFVYFGVEKNVLAKASSGINTLSHKYPIIQQIKSELNLDNILTISVNVDGLPIEKSSTKSLWPVLGVLDQANDKSPFIIAIYQGDSKPNSSNDFSDMFVKECIDLEKNGITINKTKYVFRISCFIADAPARAFLKSTVSHNSFIWLREVSTWPYESNITLRNETDFRNCIYEDHQQHQSVLTKLTLGLITQVPLDFMHLVCVGVVKKLIRVWIDKRPKSGKLSSLHVNRLTERLLIISQHTLKELYPKPRPIKYFKFWKATEFRSFILYFGPVVLKDVLPEHLYNHFLLLHVAIYLLCNVKLSRHESSLNFANELLKCFVRFTYEYYCKELLVYNFHNSLHLVEDVVNFGSLDNFSAFHFENFMKHIKKNIRGPKNPLQQVAKRINENQFTESFKEARVERSEILIGYLIQAVVFKKCSVGIKSPNNCFLTHDGNVVLVSQIENTSNTHTLMFKSFSTKVDWYTTPMNSSHLGIYKVKGLEELGEIPLMNLQKKCILLPDFSDKHYFICIPLCNSERFY